MVIRLDGEVAVVTGAASGIGRGVAFGMVEAGASVALFDLNGEGLRATAQELEALGGHVTTHEVDVSDRDAVAAAVAEAAAVHGDPTILVTAATIGGSAKLEEIEPDAWRRMFEVNVHGTFFCLQAVIAGMRRRGRGRIVLFASNLGLKGGPEIAPYATTKAAIPGLARCAAIDLADARITVNVVAPGPTATETLWDELPHDWLEAKRKELLTREFGRVDQIVPTVILLASDAGGFYTGSILNVSGGDVLQ